MELVGRVQQASLAAGRSHFNRGTHGINVESPGVYAVQVCVRAWPTCRGRAAHYSNPCVAVCARCPLPPHPTPPPISFRRGKVQCTHFQARARSSFAGSRPNIHAKHIRENVLEHVFASSNC